jgi:hypothetical protein
MFRQNDEIFSSERRLLARNMIATLERVKEAVRRFEDGEMNVEEAVRHIADAVATRRAA